MLHNLMKKDNLTHFDYHWLWGLRYHEQAIANHLLKDITDWTPDNVEYIKAKQVRIEQSYFNVLYWLFNIDNYALDFYKLHAYAVVHEQYKENKPMHHSSIWGNKKSPQSKPSQILINSLIPHSFTTYFGFSSNNTSQVFDETYDDIFTDIASEHEDKDDSPCFTPENSAPKAKTCVVTLTMQPHLKTLGIDVLTGSTLSWDTIRTYYKKAALKAHPDKGGSDSAFQHVRTAFEVLEQLICNDYSTTIAQDDFEEVNQWFDDLAARIHKFSGEVKQTLAEAQQTLAEVKQFSVKVTKLRKEQKKWLNDLKNLRKRIII